MVTWYDGGQLKVDEFGLDAVGQYSFSLIFEMFSYVPTVQEGSTWADPLVLYAEQQIATKEYKVVIDVGKCLTK